MGDLKHTPKSQFPRSLAARILSGYQDVVSTLFSTFIPSDRQGSLPPRRGLPPEVSEVGFLKRILEDLERNTPSDISEFVEEKKKKEEEKKK